jgi:hypothetical protein
MPLQVSHRMRRSSAPGCARIAHERRSALSCLHVLDFFGCLPEEEVGTDGGAEDADDHGGGFRIRREPGPDRAQRLGHACNHRPMQPRIGEIERELRGYGHPLGRYHVGVRKRSRLGRRYASGR